MSATHKRRVTDESRFRAACTILFLFTGSHGSYAKSLDDCRILSPANIFSNKYFKNNLQV